MRTALTLSTLVALGLIVGCDDASSSKPTAARPAAPAVGGGGPPVPISSAPVAAPVAGAATDAGAPPAAPSAATNDNPPAAAPAAPVSLGQPAGGAAPAAITVRAGFRVGAQPAKPAAEEPPPADPPASDSAASSDAPAEPPAATAPAEQPAQTPPAESAPAATDSASPPAEPAPASTADTGGNSFRKLKPFNFADNDNPPNKPDDATGDTPKGKGKSKKAPKPKTTKAKKAEGDETAPKNVKAGSTKKAESGVGKKGRDYGKGYLAVALATRWTADQLITFKIKIPHAMQLYKATNGYAPRSHKEFMKDIIEANLIKLPELPDGEEYLYDKDTEELMVYEVEDAKK